MTWNRVLSERANELARPEVIAENESSSHGNISILFYIFTYFRVLYLQPAVHEEVCGNGVQGCQCQERRALQLSFLIFTTNELQQAAHRLNIFTLRCIFPL